MTEIEDRIGTFDISESEVKHPSQNIVDRNLEIHLGSSKNGVGYIPFPYVNECSSFGSTSIAYSLG